MTNQLCTAPSPINLKGGLLLRVLGSLLVLVLGAARMAAVDLPNLVDLNIGETANSVRNGVTHSINLVSVAEDTQPYLRFDAAGTIYSGARARLVVDGTTVDLVARPFQLPTTVAGLRLYLECTKNFANAGIHSLEWTKDARISFVDAGETWGPSTMRFPIGNLRWHSSTYINTWGSLVPQTDLIYYHRGEDVGAIPDILPVRAAITGVFTQVPPLPSGLNSNTTRIEGGGLAFITSHMDPEYITAVLGAPVNAGDVFARTGMFWGGSKSQTQDHHCHLEMEQGPVGNIVSNYPCLVEAYLRDYPDKGIAIAGGYQFTLVNQPYVLDGSRSVARPGRTITSMQWRLHDGSIVNGTTASVTCTQEGFFAQELRVTFDDGTEERDTAVLRAFTAGSSGQQGFSTFLFHTPVRGITPGSTVTFQLTGFVIAGGPTVDWGDGSPVVGASGSMTHAFAAPGLYTVTVRSTWGISQIHKLIVRVDGSTNVAPTVATAAASAPSPVTGTTATLSVLGADDAGESGLTYTWSTTGTPPAAVAFSANGTNAAKSTVATFSKAGSYTLRATITDAGGLTVTSDVAVTVNQTLTTIAVAPTSASIANGSTQTFTATARDQFSQTQTATVTWNVSGGGTISAAGVFTATTAGGPYTVTATSGSISGTASVSVTAVNVAPTVATAAASSPSPVIGTTASLSVLGADDAGEPGLTYAWSTTGTPPAAVTFSVSGTNAAKSTVATFSKAGSYTLRATITDAGGLTVTSDVAVTVNQTLTTIAVAPTSASIANGVTQTFTVTARDQFSQTQTATVTWSVSGGGTISAAGVFTATTVGGPYTITATSGSVSGTASVSVTAVNAVPTVATAAASAPSPVTSTTASLSVLGADDAGEPGLTYAWSTTGTPPAAVTFSVNGTNAAKSTVATFSKAGSYTLRATITDAGGLSVTSDVAVTVNQTLTTIAVAPASTSVANGSTQTFTATARDQFSQTQAATVTWSVSGGGTISAAGVFTATTVGGPYTVTATSGSISGTASVSVSGLPAGWSTTTLGSVVAPGQGTWASGTFTSQVTSGLMYGTADTGRFTYQVLPGDGSIVLRVTGLTHIASSAVWNVAGPMLRIDLSAGGQNVTGAYSDYGGAPAQISADQYRLTTNGASASHYSGSTPLYYAAAAPVWMRLVRAGATVTTYAASDVSGSPGAWTTLGVVSGFPTGAAYIGLAHAGGDTAVPSTATFDNVTVTGTSTNAAPTVATAAASSPSPVTGTTATLSVLGTDDAGEAGLTYAWSTTGTPPAAVTFSVNGTNAAKSTVATFSKAGAYTLRATITDAGGLSVTSDVAVTVSQTLTTIAVAPTSASIANGTTQTFTATARDQFSQTQTATVTWSVSGGGTISAAGVFTATTAGGPYTVTATSGAVTGTASVSVTAVNAAPTVATAAASTPSPVTGTTATLSVLGADDAGESGLTYTWSTTGTPPAAVTFSVNGTNAAKSTVATFSKAGSYTLRATITDAGGLSVTSDVAVTVNQTLTTITVVPATASIANGSTQTFTATARDQFSQTQTATVTWSVSGGGTISAAGVFTATAAGGPYTVTATSGAVTGTASVSVTAVNAAPTVATAAASSPSLVTGTTATLSVLGADDAGEAGLTYAWSTTGTPPAAVTFSANSTNAAKSTVATFSKAGAYTLRATITDAGGLSVTSDVAVTVSQTLTTITVVPATASIANGSTQTFTATARDQFSQTQTATVTWSVSGGGTISAAGVFTAATAGGPYTVTATSGAVTGTASVSVTAVNAAPTVATAAASSPSPVTGTTATLSVLGADDAGEAGLTYAWSTTGTPPAAVTFSANGTNAAKSTVATFSKAGAYTLRATIADVGGLSVTSDVAVTVSQTLTTITVAPATVSIANGTTQTFTVTARDQFSQTQTATVTWSVSGGGTISAAGVFTATTVGGPYTVTATSGTVSGTATVTVTAVATLIDTTDDHLGTITAQGENGTSEGKAKAFDNATGTKWLDFANAFPSTRSSWIQYQYAASKQATVSSYTITSANDHSERDPKNWALLGSNDGVTWTTLDVRTNQTFSARFQKLTFTVAVPDAFRYYRLRIDAVQQSWANSVQISEIELIGLMVPSGGG